MSPSERVVVTGWACATGLGFGAADHGPALKEGRSAARPITRFDTTGFRTSTGATVDEARLEELLRRRFPAAALRRLGVDSRLALYAAAEALADAGLDGRAVPDPLPLMLGTTLEGFWQGEQWYAEALKRSPLRARPARLLQAQSGGQLATIAELLALPIEPLVVSNACATGVSSIGRLYRRIAAGACAAGIAGGYDTLTRFIQLGFDSLGALTPGLCAPFDRGRTGFFLGDGAAALVLESLPSARRRGARIRGEIVGYGESVDSHHPTHPDPQGRGLARALGQALACAGMAPGDVDYVNAHGTATPANDTAESKGLLLALGDEAGRAVPVSSTKPLVGHTLGAAGAVEQCFCLMALEGGFLPVQANLGAPDPECPLSFVRSSKAAPRTVLNNSLGFGGANGVLATRRWEEGN